MLIAVRALRVQSQDEEVPQADRLRTHSPAKSPAGPPLPEHTPPESPSKLRRSSQSLPPRLHIPDVPDFDTDADPYPNAGPGNDPGCSIGGAAEAIRADRGSCGEEGTHGPPSELLGGAATAEAAGPAAGEVTAAEAVAAMLGEDPAVRWLLGWRVWRK